MTARGGSSRLLGLFLGELDERLRAFDSDLVILEGKPEGEERESVVHRLFRGAHSLKGAASTVGASSIEMICHRLEDFLGALRDGLVTFAPSHADVLLKTTDALREAGRLLSDGVSVLPGTSQLLDRLSAMTQDSAPPPPAAPPPMPAPPPHPPAEPVGVAAPALSVPAPRRGGTLRVPAARIDALLQQTGELIVARHRIDRLGAGVADAAAVVHRLRSGSAKPEALRDLERTLEDLAASAKADRVAHGPARGWAPRHPRPAVRDRVRGTRPDRAGRREGRRKNCGARDRGRRRGPRPRHHRARP
jgi:two-component system chemotaxis sensor kinase CheA